ncbi:MAG: hypothetical protein A2474_07895 [Elusimicrobia bacterium RIFOXYC2_FULL_34_12]|nr:MAG: hypothetical protein A2474_07895 [Elusimicrobia bacterium RIFOXYC2_FULL_34_12]OGS39495.1 MAG: hypothetical protein A2551_00150 [Elusimicrobia bacterium RIFOXYD2_FULL_34_30]HAM39582.1 hypothetical protein [Elusimicrobiota bacterium]
MFNDIIKYGRELFLQGINNSHSGNVSCRKDNRIYITRHDAQMGDLSLKDFVAVNLDNDGKDAGASIEVKIHRAIYLANPDIKAIIHSHPPNAIVLSLNFDKITPIDAEGKYYLPEIPVVSEIERIPEMLRSSKIVLVKGHGSFAVGKDFEETYLYTSVCESASKILILNGIVKIGGSGC